MTYSPRHARLKRLLVASAAGLSLVMVADAAQAASADQMLRTAETACLDNAAKLGWRRDLAKVVSSRSIDADRVEVIFDLTRDGTNMARLTCPYSASQGVMGQLAEATGAATGAAGNAAGNAVDYGKDFTKSMATTAGNTGTAVQRSRAWWLLLPVGLAALSWAALRGRDGETGGHHAYGHRTAEAFVTTARSRDGLREGEVSVHELADGASLVRRRVRNGDPISLTGRRAHDWLEVDGGGWVHEADLQMDRATMAAARRHG